MTMIAKPIDVIVTTDKEGNMKPIRFRLQDEQGENQVFKIQRIKTTEKIRIIGTKDYLIKYICDVVVNGCLKECEIRYDMSRTLWRMENIR